MTHPPNITLTPAQKISLAERKVWLASHKAPEGMALITTEEMAQIVQGVQNETQARRLAEHNNRQLTARLERLMKMIERLAKVADAAAEVVNTAKIVTTEQPDDNHGQIPVALFNTLKDATTSLEAFFNNERIEQQKDAP